MSRASLAAVKEHLSAVLAGAAAAGAGATAAGATAAAAGLGEELFAVAGLLEDEAGLRRVLSDPSRPASAKQGLVTSLLAGKLSAAAVDLVSAVAGASWSDPADMVDATEQLAVLAVVAGADRAGQLDSLEDELFRFGRVVNADPRLRTVLSDPFIQASRKQALLDRLLGGKVTGPTMQLVSQAAARPRGRSLDVTLEEYAALAAEQRERLLAEVHVAVSLTAEQRERLRQALVARYGRDVLLNIVVDPKVIGGVSVQISGEIIDGTIAGRLAGLRRKMTA